MYREKIIQNLFIIIFYFLFLGYWILKYNNLRILYYVNIITIGAGHVIIMLFINKLYFIIYIQMTFHFI